MEKKEIILGRNPVLEYLKNSDNFKGGELHVLKGGHGEIISQIINLAKKNKIKILFEDAKYFSSIKSDAKNQGVALYFSRPGKFKKSDILKRIAEQNGTLIVLDHLTDPHNVGSIIRTAEALGSDGIILPDSRSSGLTSTVIKTAAGATAHIEVINVKNVAQFLDNAKKEGFWIIGTDQNGDKKIDEIKDMRPLVIVIGSEGDGMKRLTKEKCDFIVNIPLKGKISSLNASVAAAIVIYEILK